MKRIIAALFVLTTTAVFAEETTKTREVKTEVKSGKDKSTVKVETKTKTDPPGLMNSTTDTTTSTATSEVKGKDGGTMLTNERTFEHDAPGMKDDKKGTISRTIIRDANGNVVREDVKVDVKR
ncbi:MAG: hypothetical protein JNG84_10080 [Archangium sp.]|nr:hypothetical protein [Archangium sp.]